MLGGGAGQKVNLQALHTYNYFQKAQTHIQCGVLDIRVDLFSLTQRFSPRPILPHITAFYDSGSDCKQSELNDQDSQKPIKLPQTFKLIYRLR